MSITCRNGWEHKWFVCGTRGPSILQIDVGISQWGYKKALNFWLLPWRRKGEHISCVLALKRDWYLSQLTHMMTASQHTFDAKGVLKAKSGVACCWNTKEEIFLQKNYTNNQQAYRKVLNMTNHQSTYQNHNEISSDMH